MRTIWLPTSHTRGSFFLFKPTPLPGAFRSPPVPICGCGKCRPLLAPTKRPPTDRAPRPRKRFAYHGIDTPDARSDSRRVREQRSVHTYIFLLHTSIIDSLLSSSVGTDGRRTFLRLPDSETNFSCSLLNDLPSSGSRISSGFRTRGLFRSKPWEVLLLQRSVNFRNSKSASLFPG